MKPVLRPSQLKEEECRLYLMRMDKEAIEFWRTATDCCGALNDDLRSFGDAEFPTVILKADKVKP